MCRPNSSIWGQRSRKLNDRKGFPTPPSACFNADCKSTFENSCIEVDVRMPTSCALIDLGKSLLSDRAARATILPRAEVPRDLGVVCIIGFGATLEVGGGGGA